ncbi:MAG: TonB-dependent receptor [Cyclobacteriaceae bacterium]|nr:TonB-dependent receptor [Cyclobacteriaceae bacterium]
MIIPCQAQTNHIIKGRVAEEGSKDPLQFATVALYNYGDTSLIHGVVTDERGNFELKSQSGQYHLKVEFLSYQPLWISPVEIKHDSKTTDLGTLFLQSDVSTLDEIIVKGEKEYMTFNLDKKVFDVQQDLANAGGTAADILANIPAINIGANGTITLRGSSNVRILIDGKPSGIITMNGAEGLRQLQGNLIESIEVITTPSAKYESEGQAGVINIVLKKDRQSGLNGSFDVVMGDPVNMGGALNINYRKEKLNFFVNYGWFRRHRPSFRDIYQEVYNADSILISEQKADRLMRGTFNNVRFGADYFFNESTILTTSLTYLHSKAKRFSDIDYIDYVNTPNRLLGTSFRTQDEDEVEPSLEYAVNFKKEFGREDHFINVLASFIDNWEDSRQIFTEQIRPVDADIIDILQRSDNYETEKQWLFQVDYEMPFGNKGKLEAGTRNAFRRLTNDFFVEEQVEGGWEIVNNLSNNFVYDENILAAYAIAGNENDKLSYQAGLRVEYTDIKTELLQTGEENPRDYLDLFPSAHVAYKLPNKNKLHGAYSRRIRRPTYNDLNPFITFSDNRNFFSGNPDLDPEYTHSVEIGHGKETENTSLLTSVYYRYTRDKILSIRRVDEEGMSDTRPENLIDEDALGIEWIASFKPLNWWKFDANLNVFYSVIDGRNIDETFSSETFSWFLRLTNRINIAKTYDLQVRANYEGPQITPQGSLKQNYFVDVSMSRRLFDNRGTLVLNILDLFNTNRFRAITGDAGFMTSDWARRQVRQVNLTLNYRFN